MPIGIASLRVRGASFVIVSIALVLILLLVFQSWSDVTGGSNGLRVPRPFDESVLRPEQHERFFYLHAGLLAVALLVWWAIDRSRFGTGLKAIREDEDKAQSLGVPTFNYKLIAFVISAFFTALGGGLYALWFGFLDPIFQFSILVGSYMVLMSLLGGIRSLFGPFLGAVIVGLRGRVLQEPVRRHASSTSSPWACCSASSCSSCPTGSSRPSPSLIDRFRPQAASIREITAGELAEQRRTTDPAASTQPTARRRPRPTDRTLRRSAAMTRTTAGTATGTRIGLATVGLTKKSFGGVTAVDGASVHFHHGKVNALIGPNGSGKTTFFNCVTGMIKPDSGRRPTSATTSPARPRTGSPAPGSAAASSCAGSSRG